VKQVPESILFHTRTLSIIGDILRIALPKSEGDSPSFGDLAEVRAGAAHRRLHLAVGAGDARDVMPPDDSDT